MSIKENNNTYKYPDFLVIGAGRSGTTWLYENLKNSSDIWLPPIKEIHYFDRSPMYLSPSFLYEPFLIKRLFGSEKYNIDFRKKFVNSVGSVVFKGELKKLLWVLNFYLSNYSSGWYASLFDKGRGKVSGDITPAYQMLKQADIRKIYNLMPNCKILFIIRNPVSRTWSQLRKNKQTDLERNKIKEIILSDDVKLRNDYLMTINNYLSVFPKENFLILYYDEIIEAPDILLNRILSFLGVETTSLKKLNKSMINSSPSLDLPDDIRAVLMQSLRPLVERIARELPNKYTLKWLNEIKTGLL